ncbi:hypothetical protein [Caballeronia terrestris]|uniref:hypothetical protein n=1 Tax=Caballeronia terrestris TaxID=1226301 RepID=UPI00190EB897|nr:hypothetical protein [Caballeronia terrestris]
MLFELIVERSEMPQPADHDQPAVLGMEWLVPDPGMTVAAMTGLSIIPSSDGLRDECRNLPSPTSQRQNKQPACCLRCFT